MADWVEEFTALLAPLAEVITKHAKEDAALFADDTPLRVLVQGNEKTKPLASGAMSETNNRCPVTRHQALGIRLGLIARVSIRSNTCLAIKPGCM